MDKIWLKSYPLVCPPEINAGEFASLADLFEERREVCCAYCLCQHGQVHFSYQELDELSRQFASYLQGERACSGCLGCPDDAQLPQYPIAMFAILRVSYVVVNVNPLYRA